MGRLRSLVLVVALGGCAGTDPSPSCRQPSGCRAPCCGAAYQCIDVVCEGVLYGCRGLVGGLYDWIANATPCAVDGGAVDRGVADQGKGPVDAKPEQGCGPTSCGACPSGFCGANAECRDQRCRCLGPYLNTDQDWANGCEVHEPSCTPTNCNTCALGYCGRNADCIQNSCACKVAGFYNCDKIWLSNGCECWDGCNGTKCL